MKIGIIGNGHMAQALSGALADKHAIRLGVRAPAAPHQASLADVAGWADAVILTTPWRAEAEVAAQIADKVREKPVLDATNPVGIADHGPDVATVQTGASAAEGLKARLPGAHVVKTFNQIGAEFMADPTALSGQPVMFAAGDHDIAKRTALTLIGDAGFEGVDAGPLTNARHLESLAMLWIWQAVRGPLGRRFGFAVSHLKTEGNL
ncbi:MAG: NAD(P)-binding domain-containing protein [Pseudomonadota bacterium]